MAKETGTIGNMSKNKISPKSFDWYSHESYKNEFLLYVNPIWPVTANSENKIGEKELKREIEETISDDIKKEYVFVKEITSRRITVAFRAMRWLKDNFLKDPKVSYEFPRTLEWKWKKSLPLVITNKVPHATFKNFIEKKFKKFLKENQKTLFKDKFKILEKVNYNWFIYEADMQYNKFIVKMKYSIMIALAAAGSLVYKSVTKRK